MTQIPLISVIIPIYKVEQYINECVDSVVRQTYTNIEIILVDDGSPDKCPQMCDDWSKKDGRIKVLHKENGGLSSARNAGLRVASGEYISFVDSDDFIAATAIESLYNGICMDEDVAVSSGRIYRLLDSECSPFRKDWEADRSRKLSARDFLLKAMDLRISFTVWNKLYRRSLFENVSFKEGRNNEDTLFTYDVCREMERNGLAVMDIPDYVYYYRLRPDSICTSSKIPLAVDVIANYQLLMDDCKSNDSQLHKVLYVRYVNVLYGFLDSLLLNKVWLPLYFSKYQILLRQISLGQIKDIFGLKDTVNVQLLKWAPCIRKFFKRGFMTIKNSTRN